MDDVIKKREHKRLIFLEEKKKSTEMGHGGININKYLAIVTKGEQSTEGKEELSKTRRKS